MKTVYFDGQACAKRIEKDLGKRIKILRQKGITPKLATILVGDDKSSCLYVSIKEKVAKRLGCVMDVHRFGEDVKAEQIGDVLKKLNDDDGVDGVMIQLPLPEKLKEETYKLIHMIDQGKDVDGMRKDCEYTAPVVLAVEEAWREGRVCLESAGDVSSKLRFVVVGSGGFVGRKIVEYFKDNYENDTFEVIGVEKEAEKHSVIIKEADCVVSSTGSSGVIKKEMIRQGVVLIDVGSPGADIKTSAHKKAYFVSGVPGGVGPVTVVKLIENLLRCTEIRYRV